MIRHHRAVKAGLAVVVLAGAVWGAVTLTRPSPQDVMPRVASLGAAAEGTSAQTEATSAPTQATSALANVTTTTGMSAVDIVSVSVGEKRQDLIVQLAACNAERNAVDVAEDETRVLLYARTTGGDDGFCSDGVMVSLARELGQRTVVDGQQRKNHHAAGRIARRCRSSSGSLRRGGIPDRLGIARPDVPYRRLGVGVWRHNCSVELSADIRDRLADGTIAVSYRLWLRPSEASTGAVP